LFSRDGLSLPELCALVPSSILEITGDVACEQASTIAYCLSPRALASMRIKYAQNGLDRLFKFKLIYITYNNILNIYMFGELNILQLKVIFLGDFSYVKIFLTQLSCYHDNNFKYFMLGKYNGLVSKARGFCMHVFSSQLY
jgi:hypothetical protein